MKFQLVLLIMVSSSPWCYPNSEKKPPIDGLFFTLSGSIYHHNDSVCIDDIGAQPENRALQEDTLVCNTSNVNTNCCRSADNNIDDPIGSWFDPNNSLVIRNMDAGDATNIFVRIGFLREVRLVAKGIVTGPLGRYTCTVPSEDAMQNFSASIYIVSMCNLTTEPTLPDCTTTTEGSFNSNDSVSSGNTNRMTSVQDNGGATQESGPIIPDDSSSTIVIISAVIIIITIAAIVVILLIILYRKRFFSRNLLKSQLHFSESEQHTKGSSQKLSKDDFNQNNRIDRNPKKKVSHKNETHHRPDGSEMYSLPDKSKRNTNTEDGSYDNPKIPDMYAVVDKNVKTTEEASTYEAVDNPNIAEMYAVVDKTAKTIQAGSNEVMNAPCLSDMYAVVDKTARKMANGSARAPDSSPNLSDMYAVVDKKTNKNRTLQEKSNDDQDISDMYSVVDKSAKAKYRSK